MYDFSFFPNTEDVSKNILLTGAGFTHNFGGFLAETMWTEIHNHVQRSKQYNRLIQTLKRQYDYEELYQQIVNGSLYSDDEKTAFIDSVLEAYDSLDEVICNYQSSCVRVNLNSIDQLLSNMINNGGQRKKVFFFTLNQDIFIERWFVNIAEDKPFFLGLENNSNLSPHGLERRKLDSSYYRRVMEQKELDKHLEDKNEMKWPEMLYYIKLHGSYDWRDKRNQNKMILGKSKSDQIEGEPILKYYLQLFKKVLSLPDRRLLIIGYGFRDPHINEVLVESIKNNKLKIFVICPQNPRDFLTSTLENVENGEIIWEAIAGYYPYTLEKFFPFNSFPSRYYNNLVNDFIKS